ncbi:hypothetical protein NW758_012093 [Fusarium oxysporum]|nr:hypothetical protein NW758_012093 [Fusarium oxysporum]
MSGHATDETKGKGKVRQRRAHTRSRTGCSECRSRRVRCGEQRPTCENCVNSRRTCEYPPVKIPLRERRALEKAGATQPWEHVPWEAPSSSKGPEVPNTQALVRQLILSSSATTLDCVAIDMPLKSHELFNYCRSQHP